MFQNPFALKFPVLTDASSKGCEPVAWRSWTLFARRGLLPVILCGLLLPVAGFGQTKKDLEDKRKRLIRDIQVTDKLLQKTTQTREATYDRFLALEDQIESRQKLVGTLNDEITDADNGIEGSNGQIEALNNDLLSMQKEYGHLVRHAFRRKMLTNPLLFLLSAESLNQAFRRWLFLRKYDEYRKNQAATIATTRLALQQRIAALAETRAKKAELQGSIQNQQEILIHERKAKDIMLQTLVKDEKRLKTELQEKETARERLNQAIERVIAEEVRRSTEEARKARAKPTTPPPPVADKPATKPNAPVNIRPETPVPVTAGPEVTGQDNFSREFQLKRGQLPWPVESGFIARGYGRQKHPTLKNIEITNNGVDIRAEESAIVYAVYAGRVAGIQFIPGHDYTVIIQHGTYYTVYANLSETSLNKDDQVRARQPIGRVSNNAITGTAELHFELWYQKERLNPLAWIKK